MGKTAASKKSKKTLKRSSKKYGRPPMPKGKWIFTQDERFSKEVIEAITAYMTFTEEVGMLHGYYFNAVEESTEIRRQRTNIPISESIFIEKQHCKRMQNLVVATRLSMDRQPAEQFEKMYISAYRGLIKGSDRKEVCQGLLKMIREEEKASFPSLNLVGIDTIKCHLGPFQKMITSIVACIDQHIIKRTNQPAHKTQDKDATDSDEE